MGRRELRRRRSTSRPYNSTRLSLIGRGRHFYLVVIGSRPSDDQRPWSRARCRSNAAALFRAMRAFCSSVRPPPPEAFAGRRAGGGGLTEEQKARIARNKAAALERQRARLQGL